MYIVQRKKKGKKNLHQDSNHWFNLWNQAVKFAPKIVFLEQNNHGTSPAFLICHLLTLRVSWEWMLKVAPHSDLPKLHLIQILVMWDWRQHVLTGLRFPALPPSARLFQASRHCTHQHQNKDKPPLVQYVSRTADQELKMCLGNRTQHDSVEGFVCSRVAKPGVIKCIVIHTHPCTSDNTDTHNDLPRPSPLCVSLSLQPCLLYSLSS